MTESTETYGFPVERSLCDWMAENAQLALLIVLGETSILRLDVGKRIQLCGIHIGDDAN